MSEKSGSTNQGFDADTAPDLSMEPWPEKFGEAVVQRGRPRVAKTKRPSRPAQKHRCRQP